MNRVYPVQINEILERALKMHASDIHLTVGLPPMARVHGELAPMDLPQLTPAAIEELLFSMLDPMQKKQMETEWELDFSYAIPGVSRFRGNAMRQRGSLAVAFRVIPWGIPRLEDLGLPPVVKELSRLPRGLVLVTGPAGSGKTTTLAALIGVINCERRVNIVTIENPIEYMHRHDKSIVKQREVGSDTRSFAGALRHVLRHDPDVILIGEMRDLESISIALTAAETGHLVFSTLHTQTAPLAVHRIIDVFPDAARSQVRTQLADALKGVLAQQLLPRADGQGRVVAVEVLLNNAAVGNLIREGKEHQLYSVMQAGRAAGMQTMDHALAQLCQSGLITPETALSRCVDQMEMRRLLS